MMSAVVKNAIFISGMLATGTINTVSKKVQFGCSAPGYYNNSANHTMLMHPYKKPWFQTYLMFIGEILCLFGYVIIRQIQRKKSTSLEGVLNEDAWRDSQYSKPIFDWVFILPAMCDITGSTLQGIGLLYIDASVWQMLRGSIIVFVGILSTIFLRRRLPLFQWTGMLITVLGLCLVGLSSIYKPSSESVVTSPARAALGLFLVLAGSLATACQMIVEEVFLKRRGFHALHVVGMEGLFGAIIMGFIILPIIHNAPGTDLNGSYENQLDAIYQTIQDPVLLSTTILLILSIAFFNYFGLAVTNSLSAVHRTLLDSLRSVFVWLTGLVLFYLISHHYGEPFDSGWGLVEIDGFCMLLIGTLVFNKVFQLDCIPFCKESVTVLPVDVETTDSADDSLQKPSSNNSETRPLLAGDLGTSTGFGAIDS